MSNLKSNIMSDSVKGTYENPYSFKEYEDLVNAGMWKGGWVRYQTGVYYAALGGVAHGSLGCDDDGSDTMGSDSIGCDYYGSDELGSDTTEIETPSQPGDSTGTNPGRGGGGGTGGVNPGGGIPSGGGSGTSHSGGDEYPSGPSAQTLTSATTKLEITKGANYLSNYTKDLLLNIDGYSGTIKITNTVRTPEEQAEAMLYNIGQTGPERQIKIYADAGDKVIRVYDKNKKPEENLKAMIEKIYEVGPYNVSKHCASAEDLKKLNTFDISLTYSTNTAALYSALEKLKTQGLLRDLEKENGCIHVEVWQK